MTPCRTVTWPEEQLEIFGTDNMDEVTAEAEERWGDTDAWRESRRRTAAYTKEDWIAIKAEADANIAGFANAIRAGEPPAGSTAMELAEAHRQHLSRWFYYCEYGIHRGLASRCRRRPEGQQAGGATGRRTGVALEDAFGARH